MNGLLRDSIQERRNRSSSDLVLLGGRERMFLSRPHGSPMLAIRCRRFDRHRMAKHEVESGAVGARFEGNRVGDAVAQFGSAEQCPESSEMAHFSFGVPMMTGVRGENLLTASDLAKLCEVDLKTIHNWVDRGRVAHFRTPGRHLRFRAADVAEFLRAWGYSVPRELVRASARTGLVVGSKDTVLHVTRTLGDAMTLRDVIHPYDALVMAGANPPDVFVVDSKGVGADVDLEQWLEALHRACPDARFVVLSDEPLQLPLFAMQIGRMDAQGLRALLLPETPIATPL